MIRSRSNQKMAPACLLVLAFVLTGLRSGLCGEEYPSPVTWKPDPRAVKSGLYIMPKPPAKAEKVEFSIIEPNGTARKQWPVRGSVPLFRGQLRDPSQIRLLDAAGNALPVQAKATSFWPEKTIRFLCLDFVVDSIGANEEKKFMLEYGADVKPTGTAGNKVDEKPEGPVVDSGAAVFTFAKQEGFLTVQLKKPAWTSKPIQGHMSLAKDEKGADPKALTLSIDDIKVTENGAVQTTVHVLGHYGDQKAFHKITYYDRRPSTTKDTWRFPLSIFFRIYKGTGKAYVQHTFGYNGDEYNEFVKSYGLVIPTGLTSGAFHYGPDEKTASKAPLGVRLNQYAHNEWSLSGAEQKTGKRFGGWGALTGKGVRVFAGLREGWQNWPVALRAEKNGDLVYEIMGEKTDRALDLRYCTPSPRGKKTLHKSHSMYNGTSLSSYYANAISIGYAAGLRKIHEMMLDFGPDAGGMPSEGIAQAFQKPLVPWPGKERFKLTKALGHIGVYGDPKWDHKKRYYSILLDVYPVIHEANGLYGWVDWGDKPMTNSPKNGKFRLMMAGGTGWANGERALCTYFFHYAAGGGRRYIDLGRSMVHHTIGMDTEHEGGDYPHGNYHRHDQCHWRELNPQTSRQSGFRGWHMYYWMTGDPEVGRLAISAGIDAPKYSDKVNVRKGVKVPSFKIGGNISSCHFLAHCCWITTGNWRYAACHHGIARVVEYKTANSSGSYGTFKMVNGEPTPLAPGPYKGNPGYFYTYGEDDLLLDWAALTGDPAAVDALILLGRQHEVEKVRNSFAVYHQPEALYCGYAFLDPNNPEVPKMLARRGGVPRKDTKPLTVPTSYASAEDWAKYKVHIYGKNGFSILAPPALNILHMILAREVIDAKPPQQITLPELVLPFAHDTVKGTDKAKIELDGATLIRAPERDLIAGYEWFVGDKSVGTDAKVALDVPLGLTEIKLKVKDKEGNAATTRRTVMVLPYGKRKFSFGGGPTDFLNGHRRFDAKFGYGWDASHPGNAYTQPGYAALKPADRPHGCGFLSIWRTQNFAIKLPPGTYTIDMGGGNRGRGHGEVKLQGKTVVEPKGVPKGQNCIWNYKGEVQPDDKGLVKVGLVRGKSFPIISYVIVELKE